MNLLSGLLGKTDRLAPKDSGQRYGPDTVWAMLRAGLVTPLGTSVDHTLAGWAAAARVFQRVSVPGLADPVTVARCSAVAPEVTSTERLLQMLGSATTEALQPEDPADMPPWGHGEQALEVLVLPDWVDEEQAKHAGDTWGGWLDQFQPWNQFHRERLVLRGGTASAWLALEQAWRRLDQGEDLRHLLVAAVDSLCDTPRLEHTAQQDLVLRPGHSEGFVAGEAAGCVWLQRKSHARDVPLDRFALHRPAVVPVAASNASSEGGTVATESGAAALREALRQALRLGRLEGCHISHLLSDMDGSAWRSRIEAAALEAEVFTQASQLPHWRPAVLVGQTGVVGALLGWILPARHHTLDLGRVNSVLHWTVDPSGRPVAAGVFQRSPHID
jgi:hypothetical protein